MFKQALFKETVSPLPDCFMEMDERKVKVKVAQLCLTLCDPHGL